MRGGLGHGPYWYEYWREGKRTRKRYWGRRRPRPSDFRSDEARDPRTYDRSRMQRSEDLALLGLSSADYDGVELRRAYRRAASEHHPDRGGSNEHLKRINAAYARLRSLQGS
jgi:hypothetical protein